MEALQAYFTYNEVIVENTTYLVFPDGRVTYENRTVLLEEGGKPELYKLLGLNSDTVVYNNVTYIIHPDGQVTYENGTVVIPDGGIEKLDELLKTKVDISGTKFIVYPDGSVIFENNKTVYLPEGGMEALIAKAKYDVIQLSNGQRFHCFGDGHCTYTNGTVIVEDGGVEVLKSLFQVTQVNIYGTIYKCFPDGHCEDESGKTIVETGGPKALQAKLTYQAYEIEGVVYRVYQDGHVTY